VRALWRALGVEASKATEPVSFPDGLSTYSLQVAEWLPDDPVAQEIGEMDINDLALDSKGIWEVSHDDRGAEGVEALDLGDDHLYTAYSLNEVEHGTLRTAIPKRLRERQFRSISMQFARAQLLTSDFGWLPTGVHVHALERPEAIRMVLHALRGDGFARHVVESMYRCPWQAAPGADEDDDIEEASDKKRLQELWKAAVVCTPPCRRLPPGFAALVGRSREFEAWLERTAVHWADTRDRLDEKQAEALRMACLFLAVAA